MNRTWKIVATGALFAGLSGAAAAGGNVGFSVTVGGPGYAFGYTQPAPVYYGPPAVYYAPSPAYYAPPAVYYRPRAYYPPPPVVFYPRHAYGHGGHRGHR